MTSKSVEVFCGTCEVSIGDQFVPEDGTRLFLAHCRTEHPEEYKALMVNETALARVPFPATSDSGRA